MPLAWIAPDKVRILPLAPCHRPGREKGKGERTALKRDTQEREGHGDRRGEGGEGRGGALSWTAVKRRGVAHTESSLSQDPNFGRLGTREIEPASRGASA